jgi:hypothetical protein
VPTWGGELLLRPIIAVVVALLAAGLASGADALNDVGQPWTDEGASAVAMPVPRIAPRVAPRPHLIPARIPADCSVDVTASLRTWLAGIPNRSKIVFPARGCYEIEGTLELRNRSNLIFEGNGVTFRSRVPATDQRAIWRFIDSRNVVLRNMAIRGSYTSGGTFHSDIQHAHAIDLRGTSAEVAHVTVTDIGGDCVYFGQGFSARMLRSSGYVHDTTCIRTSRNAVSVTAGDDVLVERVRTSAIGYIAFDIEPNPGPGWGSQRVAIRNNSIGSYGLYAYAVIGKDVISDQSFTRNRATGPDGLRIAIFGGTPVEEILVSGNVPTPTS